MTDSSTAAAQPAPAPLTRADFEAAGVIALANEHVDKDLYELGKIFSAAMAMTTGLAAAAALKLLAGICSMVLVPDESADT